MKSFFRRLDWLAWRSRKEAELREELQFHLEEEAEQHQGEGLAEEQARWAARRELALAEHRASDAALVAPAFAPNSQFVVFVSDRHGKPAIYWIAVDKLVSETDGS